MGAEEGCHCHRMADMAKRVEYLAGLLKGLTAYSNTLAANDGKGFADGFSVLHEAGVGNACKAAQDPENVPKNRYRNVPGMCPRGLYALDLHIYDSLASCGPPFYPITVH